MKIILTALSLSVLPGLSLAAGCSWSKTEQTATSCAAGYAWDAASQSCIQSTTS